MNKIKKKKKKGKEVPCGIEKVGCEEQSQRQGEQVAEEEEEECLTAAKPSLKCQQRGGPNMYPAMHTATTNKLTLNNITLELFIAMSL